MRLTAGSAGTVTQTSNLKGIILMLLAGMAFVANDSLIKLTLAELPPMQVLVLRGLFGTVWCLAVLFWMGFGKDIGKAFRRWVLLRSLFELVAIMAFINGLAHMPIGDVTAIYQISPLLVTMGAAWFYREKVQLVQYAFIAIALVGALLVAQPGSSTATVYAVFPFITAIGAAGRDLAGRRIGTDVPGLVVAFSTIVVVLLASIIVHMLTEEWVPPSTTNLGVMAVTGLFLLLGHTLVFLAYRNGKTSAIAPFGYAFTAWAVLAGLLVFNDVPNALSVTGMLFIVASGLAALWYDQRKKVKSVKGDGLRSPAP